MTRITAYLDSQRVSVPAGNTEISSFKLRNPTRRPFRSVQPGRSSDQAIAIGGHRGMGENLLSEDHEVRQRTSYWRENTIKSFLKAVEHGATFIEFDVQVTKDGIPVVWHDDYITHGPCNQPFSHKIRDLTFEEFKLIGHRRALNELQEFSPVYRHQVCKVSGKVKHEQWKCSDEDELPSLAQVFEQLASHVGFNIEIKMSPGVDLVQTGIEEVEYVTSSVLEVVEQYMTKGEMSRTIVFSSFDPEVVKILKVKQSSVITMFLSSGEAGIESDPRRQSFFEALDWAHSNDLDGVVLDSSVLRKHQDIVAQADALGLVVMSYGVENNDHDWVKKQFHLGVHGAIVDDVGRVVPKIVNSLS